MKRQLDPIAIKKNLKFFSESHAKNPDSNFKALHYNSAENQVLRFITLTQIGQLEGSRILDFGCGFGDLCYLLDKSTSDFGYLGVDINPKFISHAQDKYPKHQFEVFDLESDLWSQSFDWVIACGVFNIKLESRMTPNQS